MAPNVIGVVSETAPGEHRVALTPDTVARVSALGMTTVVARDAGASAWWPDSAYQAAGAHIADLAEVCADADVLLCVDGTSPGLTDRTHPGQLLVGLLRPLLHPALVARWAAQGVTAVSLDLLPRTLSWAQSMDALTSQATVAGYKAAVLAADTYGGFFPMLTTVAGTMRPGRVLVLGAGVAGLQAIATARRMGAEVTGYDLRPAARADIASLGAGFLDVTTVETGAGGGGYARALTVGEQRAQQAEFAHRIAGFDVLITTAQVPGHRPPVLVTVDAVHRMRPGSVIVDLAAGPLGGNVEGAEADTTTVLAPGIVVVGAGNLPSALAPTASAAYAGNITTLLAHLAHDGRVAVDLTDELQAAVVVTHDGRVVHPEVTRLLDPAPVPGEVR